MYPIYLFVLGFYWCSKVKLVITYVNSYKQNTEHDTDSGIVWLVLSTFIFFFLPREWPKNSVYRPNGD